MPSVVEARLPGVVSYSWYCVVASAGTPEETISQLNRVVNEFIAPQEMQEQLKNDAAVPGDLSAAQFSKMIADEAAAYRRAAPLNIRLD